MILQGRDERERKEGNGGGGERERERWQQKQQMKREKVLKKGKEARRQMKRTVSAEGRGGIKKKGGC